MLRQPGFRAFWIDWKAARRRQAQSAQVLRLRYAMAEAVMQVTPCHPSNVKYRMIEALESLDDALDRLRVRRVG